MRLAYFSDLHLEFRVQQPHLNYPLLRWGPDLEPLKGQVDALLLAGDIGDADQHCDYVRQALDFLEVPVIGVPGNHEYYGSSFPNPSISDLDRSQVVLDGIRFLCCTLWTDFNCFGDRSFVMQIAPKILNDFQVIRGMSPQVMLNEHQTSRHWLLETLREPFGGKTVIMTHNSPHTAARNRNHPFDMKSACFVTDCNDVLNAAVAAGVTTWIYGHDHYTQSVDMGDGLWLRSAQVGYPGERAGWSGVGFVEV
jgi:hypothetical protein